MIKILDKSVSNKIAAGEVVERPVSVVKELVENSIDAGASAVSIDISEGGIKSIGITDNGSGIAADEVKIAFEKHATSKITTIRDLGHIVTQGFRGEALSSIAAVSVTDLRTKTHDEETGTHIRISGGRMDFCNPAGLPEGTSITVSNLFFNVPARRKFLKKPGQEAAYISDLISRYILSFPEISFHYKSSGRTIYHSPGSADLKEAIYCVYGGDVLDSIAYVDEAYGGIRVWGYAARPGTSMRSKNTGSIFVNRRYVRNRLLFDMVKNAYGQTLVKGDFPFFALNIELPASLVDVNVHPNKLQVRFSDSAAVEHVISEAVSSACGKIYGSISLETPKQNSEPARKVEMKTPQTFVQEDLFSGFERSVMKEEHGLNEAIEEAGAYTPWEPQNTPQSNEEAQQTEQKMPQVPQTSQIADYRVIGSFANTYILVEQSENLLLIDQHAAHERLLFEKFAAEEQTASQRLLIPKVIKLSHEQMNIIDENIDVFRQLGFDMEPFGALEYKLSALPSLIKEAGAEQLILDVLSDVNHPVLRRDDLIRTACRRAVKANDRLSDAELSSLVGSFLETDVIPTCPHGRPIITVLSKKQIEKSFKRTL